MTSLPQHDSAARYSPAERTVLCQGRALCSEELLGLKPAPAPRRALPLVLVAWLGLLLVVTHPVVSLATLLAAPLVLVYLARQKTV